MEYIYGQPARDELANATPDQDAYFLKQMAYFQCKLAEIRFKKIGSIVQITDGFVIGPDVETGAGPFEKETDYYEAVAKHRISRAKRLKLLEKGCSFNGADLFFIFLHVLRSNGDTKSRSDYGLANRDSGPHNYLVDDDFKVVALIDLDFVIAAPLHCVGRLCPQTFFGTRCGLIRLGRSKKG